MLLKKCIRKEKRNGVWLLLLFFWINLMCDKIGTWCVLFFLITCVLLVFDLWSGWSLNTEHFLSLLVFESYLRFVSVCLCLLFWLMLYGSNNKMNKLNLIWTNWFISMNYCLKIKSYKHILIIRFEGEWKRITRKN